MKTIEVNLPEPTASRIDEMARRLGIAPEELLRISLEEKLARLDDAFHEALEVVVNKNAELYKRLA